MRLWLDLHQNWAIKQLVLLLVSALVLGLVFPMTGLDQYLIAPYFDADNQQFSLKHDWFLESVLHTGLKYGLIVVAFSTLVAAFIGSINVSLKVHHQRLLWVFMLMLISTTLISLLKHSSMHACPNDLIQYGGNLPYLQLFDALPVGAEAGKCFPGGHASGGFALMAFYFAFRDVKPQFAKSLLLLSLSLGFVMGWAQMMRGEHFLSHNLWSAWVVWAICLICQPLLFILTLNKNLNIKKAKR
jgi:membrane-associated PAP2 superfamily phosphatase